MAAALLAAVPQAKAQESVIRQGDAVVTGFSGIKPSDAPLAPGANPLDEFFIDVDGPSAQIMSFATAGAAPNGQLLPAVPTLQLKAGQIGQVFASTLDDGLGAEIPNIYLGATAAYGLQIVLPDADGWAERTKLGAPNAEWMAGQFGADLGGGPGAIYKVDGKTGTPTLFATLPGNSGPGVGDVVFDKGSRQFFASDLDTGMIYRISETGDVIDSFDHGVNGRPAAELAPVADDATSLNIENPAFDSENPDTWAFTPSERRVHSIAINGERLYYAVNGQIWSIGISAEGFAEDARWELDAEALVNDGPVTDMLFDNQGRLYLAQRGGQRGSYNYAVFAEPEKSKVVRYSREEPDDPATESVWVEDAEEYAIGLPPEHRQAEGGIALGYPHDENGALRYGSCGEMLWSTGHRLRSGALEDEAGGEADAEADVHGLQGNAISLVRPENVPPVQSYFVDYDGFFGDAAKSGHMGDVEIWQPCEGRPDFSGPLPPGIFPPGDTPPDLPPEFPPEYSYETNLKLTKRASPKECSPWFGGWLCRYRIRIRNTGPDDYFGPVLIEDWLPANPAGSAMGFTPTPPWSCWNSGPSAYKCFRPGVFLAPGSSIGLTAYAWVPNSYGKCNLRNVAAIEWAPGGTQWNTDPFDDLDDANALIPSKECEDPKEETDLKIYKRALLPCFKQGDGLRCGYRITVENQGPGAYNGDIVVKDTIPPGTTGIFSGPPGLWDACPNIGNVHTCTAGSVNLPVPGASISLTVRVDLSHEQAREMGCQVRNLAEITEAPGGSPQNTDPTNDTASAVAIVPEELCRNPQRTDLKIYKRALSCYRADDNLRCAYRVTVRNMGPGNYNGDIKVEDTIPAGMNAQFSGPPGVWNCGGASPTYTCTASGASLPPLGALSFFVRVDFTREQARQNECRIRNRVEITEAPGGTPQNFNPANDTANAVATVPARLCEGNLRTNLKIEKKASPAFCTRSGNDWWCRYAIRVINMGPGTYNGPLEVEEALPGEPLDANWNAPWNCAGIGGAGAVCTHPNTSIPALSTRILFLNVKFSEALVKDKNCLLPNVAKITEAPGGTPKNTNPADDISGDTARVPPRFCEKEETNLQLTKQGAQPECNTTGGGLYRCPYNVIVKNVGSGKYEGKIVVRDYMPDEASGATMQVPAPWVCEGDAPSITCTHPFIALNPGQQVVMPVNVLLPPAGYGSCALTNAALIEQAPGGSIQNQIVGDDKDSATLQFPPLLVDNQAYCVRPEPIKPCPPGFEWNGRSCNRIGTGTPIPPPPSRDCPQGYAGNYPDCKRIVDPAPECPEGTVGRYPNCRTIVDEDPQCTGGRIERRGRCVCPARLRWNGQRCVRQCPPGTRGVYPDCRKVVVDPPRKCPPGTVGRFPRCRKVLDCTGGRVQRGARCVCPRGLDWNGKRCVRTPNCTGGRVLRGSRCVCPRGLDWNGKRCVRTPNCTGGRVLRGSRCVCPPRLRWNGQRCERRTPVLRLNPQRVRPDTRREPAQRLRQQRDRNIPR